MRISVIIPVAVYLWTVISGYEIALSSAAAVLVHEAGHLAAGLLLRRRISFVTLSLPGADIEYTGAASYKADLVTALCGPAFSIAAAVCFYGIFPTFSIISAVYGFLNLVPVPCFDGGRIITDIFYTHTSYKTAETVCSLINIVFLILLYDFSVFILFYTSFNASLLLVCVYLFVKNLKM